MVIATWIRSNLSIKSRGHTNCRSKTSVDICFCQTGRNRTISGYHKLPEENWPIVLVNTWSDNISVIISIISPKWLERAEENVVRCFKISKDNGLWVSNNAKAEDLVEFSDADWSREDRKFNTGFKLKFNGANRQLDNGVQEADPWFSCCCKSGVRCSFGRHTGVDLVEASSEGTRTRKPLWG